MAFLRASRAAISARRLNPLHGDYEIWQADRHYWAEAYVNERWTLYEPSPWASLPQREAASPRLREAAKEYVRLAQEHRLGAEVSRLLPRRPADAYLATVLAWGWIVTCGPWALLALVAVLFVGVRFQRLLRPVPDGLDLLRLRRRGDPRWRVLTGYKIVERAFRAPPLASGAAENHVEYLSRLAAQKPHLQRLLSTMSQSYCGGALRAGRDGRWRPSRRWAPAATSSTLIDEEPQPA